MSNNDYNSNESAIKSQSSTTHDNPVVSHYNNKKEIGLEQRTESRIFYLRNFNNWIKSILIKEHIIKLNKEKENVLLSVLDLGCGRGGDIKKWMKSKNVNYVLFADVASKSLDECKERYKQTNPIFKADFLNIDLTTELISQKYDLNNHKFDLVSCQFVLHYSFETFKKANNFIKNVSDSLNIGGYFIGITTDAYEIVKRLNESGTSSFGNEVYNVKYLNDDLNTENIPLFGAKINFELDGVVDCPEYLLHFPTFVRLALKHNLRLVYKKRFSDFFNDYSNVFEYTRLLQIMSAIEPYDCKNESNLKGKNVDEYEHVRNYLREKYGDDSEREMNNIELGTLSKSEWEAETLYVCFGFQKF